MPFDSPLYKAGVAEDDQIVSLAGVEVTSAQDVQDVLAEAISPGRGWRCGSSGAAARR